MDNSAEIPLEGLKHDSIEAPQEALSVDTATFESEAFIELEMEFEAAEAVQSAFVEVVAAITSEAATDLPNFESEPPSQPGEGQTGGPPPMNISSDRPPMREGGIEHTGAIRGGGFEHTGPKKEFGEKLDSNAEGLASVPETLPDKHSDGIAKVIGDFSNGVDANNPTAVEERFSDFIEDIGSGGVPIDLNSRVQELLREAYDKSNDDLAFETDKQSSGEVISADYGDAAQINDASPGEARGIEGDGEFRGTVIDFSGRAGVGEGYFLSALASLAANDPGRLDGGGESSNIRLQVGPEAGSITVGGIATESSVAGKIAGTGSDSSDAGDKDRIIINLDGSDDGGLDLDDDLVQVIDLHQDNQIKDQYGLTGDARNESVGYQDPGSMTDLADPGGTHDVPEAVPGGGPPGRDIPGLPGQDDMEGWADRPDLRGAAAAGGDPRVGADTADAADDAADATDDAADVAADAAAADQAAADQAAADQAADDQDAADFAANNPDAAGHMGKHVGRKVDSTVKTTAGRIWKQVTAMYTTADKASSAHVGVRGTPNPDAVDGEFDDTLGGLVPGILPDASPDDLGAASLMQPMGEDSDREKPREDLKAEMAGSDVDPLAYYTDEHVDLPKTTPDTVDVDGNLIDPPKPDTGVGGSEQGLEDSDASDRERAD